jgi:hypothetical protein
MAGLREEEEREERGPISGWVYERHAPEHTLLYRVIAQYYPQLVEHLAREQRQLPSYVQREFAEYLRCGRLEYGFLRVRCQDCHAEKRVAFSCKRRGFCPSCAPVGSALGRQTKAARRRLSHLAHLSPREWESAY